MALAGCCRTAHGPRTMQGRQDCFACCNDCNVYNAARALCGSLVEVKVVWAPDGAPLCQVEPGTVLRVERQPGLAGDPLARHQILAWTQPIVARHRYSAYVVPPVAGEVCSRSRADSSRICRDQGIVVIKSSPLAQNTKIQCMSRTSFK